MGKRRKLLFGEEEHKIKEEALKRTEILLDFYKRKQILSDGKSYLDFADEVVAGLFYAYKSCEINKIELCRRVGIISSTNERELLDILSLHPRWAILEATYNEHKTVIIGHTKMVVPIGLLTDDRSLASILRFNIARLLTSEHPRDIISGSKIYLAAVASGVIRKHEEEPILREWTHIRQEGEKELMTFETNQEE